MNVVVLDVAITLAAILVAMTAVTAFETDFVAAAMSTAAMDLFMILTATASH